MASSSIKSGRYNFDANVIVAVLFAFPVAVLFATGTLLSRVAHLLHKWERSGRTAPLPLEEQGTARLFRNCAIPFTMPAPHSWQYRDRQEEPVKLPAQPEPTSFPLAIPVVPVAVPAEPLMLSFGTVGDIWSQEIVPNAPAAPVQVSEEVPPVAPETEEESTTPTVKVKTPTRARTSRVKVAALPPPSSAPPAPLALVSGEEETSESIPTAPSEASNSPQEPTAADDLDRMNREDLRALWARMGIKVKGAGKLGSGALRTLIRQHRAASATF